MTVAELRAKAPYVNFIKTKMLSKRLNIARVKRIAFLAPLFLAALSLSSCASLGRIIRSDYSVPIQESCESVKAKADKIMAQKSYMKRFSAVDKFDKKRDVVILDYQYFTIDGVLYAYQFNNMMYYGPALSFGKSNSFAGRPSDAGYFDDFGKWHEYGHHDYFENVFKTRKQDVPLEMYQALQKR